MTKFINTELESGSESELEFNTELESKLELVPLFRSRVVREWEKGK